jgi:hypothetical protein
MRFNFNFFGFFVRILIVSVGAVLTVLRNGLIGV